MLVLVLIAAAGCQQGIAWHDYDYPRVLADSRANNKLTFVYFRDFASVECTQFEDGILATPQARSAIGTLYAVPLQWNTLVDAPLAQRWQIKTVPAYVIVDPRERVLARRSGKMTLEQLLTDISRAQAAFRGKPEQADALPTTGPASSKPGSQ
jgi:hypothetical protein